METRSPRNPSKPQGPQRAGRGARPRDPVVLRDRLQTYRAKRDFERTAEPSGRPRKARAAPGLRYLIQKHAAPRRCITISGWSMTAC